MKTPNPIALTSEITATKIYGHTDHTCYVNLTALEMVTIQSIEKRIKKLRSVCKAKGIKLRVSKKKLQEVKGFHDEYIKDVHSYNNTFRNVKEDWERIVDDGISAIGGFHPLMEMARKKMEAVAFLLYSSNIISCIHSYSNLIDRHLREAEMHGGETERTFYLQ